MSSNERDVAIVVGVENLNCLVGRRWPMISLVFCVGGALPPAGGGGGGMAINVARLFGPGPGVIEWARGGVRNQRSEQGILKLGSQKNAGERDYPI